MQEFKTIKLLKENVEVHLHDFRFLEMTPMRKQEEEK